MLRSSTVLRIHLRVPQPWLLTIAIALIVAVVCGVGFASPLQAQQNEPTTPRPFRLNGGETILFYGDSITQGGDYVTYIEGYLLTRFPDKQFRIINHGISSETLSGLSEPGHDPIRPNAHDRFMRDVAAWKPDVLSSCFGMNDGIYHPYSRERHLAYTNGVLKLLSRVQASTPVKWVTLVTPPPYDASRRGVSDPNASTFGYKHAAVDYDDVLSRFAEFLKQLESEHIVVADVHTASNEHLRRRREKQASFHVSADAVHPNATGHWLIAQTILESWNAPAEITELRVHFKARIAPSPAIQEMKKESDRFVITATIPVPMPSDPNWDAESMALERVSEKFNHLALNVQGLDPATNYQVLVDGKPFKKEATARELASLPLNELVDRLQAARSQPLLKLLQERNRATYANWRKEIAAKEGEKPSVDDAAIREKTTRIHELRQPVSVKFELVPITVGK